MDVQSGPGLAPAGWYQDPASRHQFRYWDGLAWTDIVSDNGRQSVDSLSQASPPRACENCHGPCRPGQRVVYYAGRKVGEWTGTSGIYRLRGATYEAFQRSSIFLCEQCAKSLGTRHAAVERKLAGSGLACWLAPEFEIGFVKQVLKDNDYVRVRDIMQDDLATPQAAGDATLVFRWKGKYVIEDAALIVSVDDVHEGFGSFKKGFSALVHVPAGAHKVSISIDGMRASHQIGIVEPGMTYEADLVRSAWGKMVFELKPVN
jgi:hypothetical protein